MSWLSYMSWILSLGLLLWHHAVSCFKMSKHSLELQSLAWQYGFWTESKKKQSRTFSIVGPLSETSDSIWRLEIIIFTGHTLWFYHHPPAQTGTDPVQHKPNHSHNGINSHYRHKGSVIFRCKYKLMKTQKNKQHLIPATCRQRLWGFQSWSSTGFISLWRAPHWLQSEMEMKSVFGVPSLCFPLCDPKRTCWRITSLSQVGMAAAAWLFSRLSGFDLSRKKSHRTQLLRH